MNIIFLAFIHQLISLQEGGSRKGPSHMRSMPLQSSCGCSIVAGASSMTPNFGAKSNFNIEIHTLKRLG